MAITKAAKKAIRQSARRRLKNIKQMRELKKLLKEAKRLVSQGKNKEVEKLLPKIYKTLDKAGKAGLIEKNTASRKKARIARSLKLGKK